MKIKTWTIEKRGKIVDALTNGKITANEAILLMIEADNRDYVAKKGKNETSANRFNPT